MASLINCQNVVSYTAEEFAGDTPFGGENDLELQSPPSGAVLEGFETASFYYLVIASMPEYRIDRSMINIGDVITSDVSIFAAYPNGIAVYNSGSNDSSVVNVIPENVVQIRIYDSLSTDFSNCDNKVIVEVKIDPGFVMPASNYTISIDLGGTAVECEPVISDETIQTWLQIEALLYITNFGLNMGYSLYTAHYYDDESYASSNFNTFNSYDYLNIPASGINGDINTCEVPVYDFNGNYQAEYPQYTNDCFDNYQPTCYALYGDGGMEESGWFDGEDNISTICAQLSVGQSALGIIDTVGGMSDLFNPDGLSMMCNTNNKAKYSYKIQSNPSSYQYLSEIDYPIITPGDPMIPNALSWYISVGDNSDYDLEAIEETIDVWKIVTVVNQSSSSGFPPDNTCTFNDTPVTAGFFGQVVCSEYFVSDSTEENSDLNLSGKTIEYVDNKTVKLTIPFKTDLSINRFESVLPESGSWPTRQNKIFLNIYPTYIGQ